VLLSGLGLDVSEMSMLTGPLAASFQVTAVDNRGAGRSAKPVGPYSIEQMAADIAGLMHRLGLPRAHLAGISLGGRIAMALALDWPDRVDRLILVATSPAEELPHVADQQVGCLHGGEVAAAAEAGPVWCVGWRSPPGCDRYGLTICPDGRITYQYPPSSFLPWPAA